MPQSADIASNKVLHRIAAPEASLQAKDYTDTSV